jgi:hypothetical protein
MATITATVAVVSLLGNFMTWTALSASVSQVRVIKKIRHAEHSVSTTLPDGFTVRIRRSDGLSTR